MNWEENAKYAALQQAGTMNSTTYAAPLTLLDVTRNQIDDLKKQCGRTWTGMPEAISLSNPATE